MTDRWSRALNCRATGPEEAANSSAFGRMAAPAAVNRSALDCDDVGPLAESSFSAERTLLIIGHLSPIFAC
jgi:hypothetical protein